jgi:phosphonate transport system ATP-binding protein
VIRVKNLSMFYANGVKALLSTDLHFNRGEFTVLLGPSGAGKSTLLKCLNVLVPPSTGKITSDDLGEIKSRTTVREHRRQTAMIFQQHQLIARYTAFDNVLIGRIGYHSALRSLFPLPQKDKVFALACLERVGLLEKALQRIDRLSGGEQQRVGIARALAQQPRSILADEPVASLDPATAIDVLTLLQRICKEQSLTTIVSLHQVDLAKRYADRVIGLSEGRVVFDDAPEKLTQAVLNAIYSRKDKSGVKNGNVARAVQGLAPPALSP